MEPNRSKIICDTNIWYRIFDGRISINELTGKFLVGTYISGFEFGCTLNALNDFNLFRNAVIAFKGQAQQFYKEHPIEYIKLLSNYPSNSDKWIELNESLNKVFGTKEPNPAYYDAAKHEYEKYYTEASDLLEPFVRFVDDYRNSITNKGLHKKNMNASISRLQQIEATKSVITNWFQGVEIKWEPLELFLNVFNEWLRQLDLQNNLKMNLNDWNDVFNLVYVAPGDLYWTRDYKKTWEFIKQAGLSHYLFEPEKVRE
ncbi:hypothetical protein [Spirosoma montaniterrae]|uniref:Uncharacterized protein n=1 Tax=Spirosoma montaniterrae TaxID=1178516 RepID=A0A1P9X371_9BACT|nr:hypothetical protein [Spirosoma montaniterrae]AQG82035.1 hypothetical protein AWR27_23700 [Spirosoma montaniterrae]